MQRSLTRRSHSRAEAVTMIAKAVFGVVALALLVAELVAVAGSISPAPPEAGQAVVPDVPPPPRLPPSGSWSESRVLPDGDIAVTTWIRNRVPISHLTLVVPDGPGGRAVWATAVVVGSEGRVLARPQRVGTTPRTVDLGVRAHLVYVGYRLTGATGRDGTRIVTLDVAYRPRVGPARVFVRGHAVVGLSCRNRDAATAGASGTSRPSPPEPCGRIEDGRWSLELTGSQRRQAVLAAVRSG